MGSGSDNTPKGVGVTDAVLAFIFGDGIESSL